MSVDITELHKIDGVTDVFLYSQGGELLAPQLPYTAARIGLLGRELALSSILLKKMNQEVDFFEFIYENKRVIVRTSQTFFILVICENDADTALIKLTMNVLHEDVKADKDIQKALHKSSVKRDLLAEAQEESDLRDLLIKMKVTS